MHYDYFYFTRNGQCFKFGYSKDNNKLTVGKEDSILTYISNAIVFTKDNANANLSKQVKAICKTIGTTKLKKGTKCLFKTLKM
jgi:hypothetical protein